jgi:hypothetical protein
VTDRTGCRPGLPRIASCRCRSGRSHVILLAFAVLPLGQQKFEAGEQTCRDGVDHEIYA